MNLHLFLNINWQVLDKRFMGESVSSYISFFSIIIFTLLLKKPAAALLTRVSSSLATRFSYAQHKDIIKTMLVAPMERLLQIILYYIAANQLSILLDRLKLQHLMGRKKALDLSLGEVVDHVFLLLFIVYLTQVILRFVDFIYYLRMGKAQTDNNRPRMQLLPLIKEMSKLLLIVLSLFWALGAVFHVNIPALITGLGIGGVAIALAGKETVENFFAALTILSDSPFQVGDFVKLADAEGTVERIGFRSTRLRSVDGSAFIMPNRNLVNQSLTNLSMRSIRRMTMTANLRYGLSHDDLAKLIADIKATLGTMELVQAPIDVTIETLDKETMQITTAYFLPHPLPVGDASLVAVKQSITMALYAVITSHTDLGTPPVRV